jgi:hypothetical protein
VKIGKKVFLYCWLGLLVFTGFRGFADDDDYNTSGAVLENFKLPHYKGGKEQERRLDFVVYGKRAESLGVVFNLDDVLVDLVSEKVKSINDVKDLHNVKLYPLGEDAEKIRKFWENRIYSKALLWTPKAACDQATKIIKGDHEVKLRSPGMDLDGVGFDADYENETIHIRKDVKVVIRMEELKANNKKQAEADEKTVPNKNNIDKKVSDKKGNDKK